jgi:hypothetical protein
MRTPFFLAIAALLSVTACGSDDAGSSNSTPKHDAGSDAVSDATQDAGVDGPNDGSSDAVALDGAADASPDADCDGSCEPAVTMLTEVSQYGITWTFDKSYPCGQFVTGDWWVVGPVKVVSVSPAPTGVRNGSMLNPVNDQAYDARAGKYDGSKAVSFPLALSPKQSLVSSISHPEASECTQGSSPGWNTYNGQCQRGPIHTQAVLTAVPEPQWQDTFRPPYSGDSKPFHRSSSACWGLLPKLPPPASAPEGSTLLRHMERPWIDHINSWTMQHGCATHNMFCYGREIGNIVAQVSTFALLDTPEQEQLATQLIQLGIDNYGVLQAGGSWGVDGGHFNGRKWPIVFAGAMLNDGGMRSPGTDFGNEDQQTYYGTNGDALWGRACSDACYFTSGCQYAGACTAGSKDCRDPAGLIDGCEGYRNCCTSVTWVGTGLAAHILGLKDDWGHDAFFDYIDRWMDGDVSGGGGTSAAFVTELWSTYRNNLPPPGTCP